MKVRLAFLQHTIKMMRLGRSTWYDQTTQYQTFIHEEMIHFTDRLNVHVENLHYMFQSQNIIRNRDRYSRNKDVLSFIDEYRIKK